MKVAIVGGGRWGKVLLQELEKQAEVLYICTKSNGKLGEALGDAQVEAVFIATPTETHFTIANQALEAGKYVFLEKPGTTSSSDLEKLVRQANEKNLKFAVGYEFPHHPVAQKLKALLTGKTIKSMAFDWQKWGTFKDDAVHHLLCHDISIMKFLGVDNLTPLSCKKTRVISDSDILEAEFSQNITSRINRVSPIKQKTVTILTEGAGYVWSNNQLYQIDRATQDLVEIPVLETTPVAEEIKDFLGSISENREPLCNGKFALEVYRVIETVQA